MKFLIMNVLREWVIIDFGLINSFSGSSKIYFFFISLGGILEVENMRQSYTFNIICY